jgi:tetratricopeptide (TPR) repeat protein
LPSSNQPIKNRINDRVNELGRNHLLANLEEELLKLRNENLNTDEQSTWHHMYGVATYNRGDRALAFKRFEEAFEKFPDNPYIQFALGQEYENIGKIEEAIELFKKSSFPKIPSKHTLFKARCAYLWSRYDDGLSFIQPIFEAYEKLKIVDDTFLYLRGLPFFSETWLYFVCFNFLKNNLSVCRKLLDHYKKTFRDYNFNDLEMDLIDLEKSAFESTISRDKQTIEEYKKSKTPFGIPIARLNLFKTRTTNFQNAKDVLKNWLVEPNDFRWLIDVRLLAEAELLWKNNDPGENLKIDNFFRSQPLLFEPNHVSYFRFFDYQEKLKSIYIQKKQKETIS